MAAKPTKDESSLPSTAENGTAAENKATPNKKPLIPRRQKKTEEQTPAPKKAPREKAKKPVEKKPVEKKPAAKKPQEKKPEKKKPAASTEPKKKSISGLKFLGGMLFKRMAEGGAGELAVKADEVNRLNVFPVPDGDTGDNMRMTIESGVRAVENLDSDDLAAVMKALSHGMLLGARGNSGVILSQFFAGMSKGLESMTTADPEALGKAMQCGVDQAYSSVMTPTEGTILTVAREAVAYAVSRINPKSTIRSFFKDLVGEMHASVERTPEILPMLKDAGVVDSGGAGLFYIIDGFYRVLKDQPIEGAEQFAASHQQPKEAESTAAPGTDWGADSRMEFGYCTELLLQLRHEKCNPDEFDLEGLKSFLSTLGDSIVAFKTDSIVKLHVHTFTPDRVLAKCLESGDFITVKIENMSLQHTESKDTAPAEAAPEEKEDELMEVVTEATEEKKTLSVVAVCNGEGIISLYKGLGTDVIIHGGQTNNPSTNDFLDAFSKINAEHIIVLPNNGNILMAAQQAEELYTDAKVHVIPSKSMATGYVALSAVDLEGDPEAAVADMKEEISRVTAAFISPSIRDADMNGVHVDAGDTIGIVGKDLVVSNRDRLTAAITLGKLLLSKEDVCMLTVFVGQDAPREEAESLEQALKESFPRAEIYFSDGGQEIYPYLLVAE